MSGIYLVTMVLCSLSPLVGLGLTTTSKHVSINLYNINYRINSLVLNSRSNTNESVQQMALMVPGYVVIIPFHNVTKQHQLLLQNLPIIRPIPAVINPLITVKVICSISIFQNILIRLPQVPFQQTKTQSKT